MISYSFFIAVIHLSVAWVYCYVHVKQRPNTAYHTARENVTMWCESRANGGEKIATCVVHWYMQTAVRRLEVSRLLQFRGRFGEHHDSGQRKTRLELSVLEPNDSGMYYCSFFCRVNGRTLKHTGTGTNLTVYVEAPMSSVVPITASLETDAVNEKNKDDTPTTLLFFVPVSLKLVVTVLICAYTLVSYNVN